MKRKPIEYSRHQDDKGIYFLFPELAMRVYVKAHETESDTITHGKRLIQNSRRAHKGYASRWRGRMKENRSKWERKL